MENLNRAQLSKALSTPSDIPAYYGLYGIVVDVNKPAEPVDFLIAAIHTHFRNPNG